MNKIKGVLRNNLNERPFDFYVAFLLFVAGIYSIISDHWPEDIKNEVMSVIITIISIYFIAASIVVMLSLACRRRRWPVLSLMGEMYGWLFIGAASFATVFIYVGSAIHRIPESWAVWTILLATWFGLFLASGLRFLDLFNIYKGFKQK